MKKTDRFQKTYRIEVEKKERSNLSGTILMTETGEKKNFAGVLELLKIIDGTLDDETDEEKVFTKELMSKST